MPSGTLRISDGEYHQVNSMYREAIEEIREEKTIGKKTGTEDGALIVQ